MSSSPAETASRGSAYPAVLSLRQIMETSYPPLREIVQGLLLEGLIVLAAPSKIGKTFLGYGVAVAVAEGRPFLGRRTERGEVLYLHLEGGPRSIKSRALFSGLPPLENLFFVDSWPRGPKALTALDSYLAENPGTNLVVLDVLARVRVPSGSGPDYATEYPEFSAWRELAERHRVCVLALTHTRKGLDEGADFVNESYGGGALAGAANGIIQIRRPRGSDEGTLKATFRDAPELELSLRFNPEDGSWTVSDSDPREASQTPERRELLALIPQPPLSTKTGDLAKQLGKSVKATSKLLSRLSEEGLVHSPRYGEFASGDGRRSGRSGRTSDAEAADELATSPTSSTSPALLEEEDELYLDF